MHLARFLIAALVLLPAISSAATAERLLRLGTGSTTTEQIAQPVRVHVDNTDVVSAKQLSSMEMEIEALSPGTATVFLHGDEGVSAWRVLVDSGVDRGGKQEAIEAARKACEALRQGPDGIEVTVQSAQCQKKVVQLSEHLLSSRLVVRFKEEGLLAQLRAQDEALSRKHPDLAVSLAYLGATLRISGRVDTVEERDALVRTLWQETAGRMLVDMRTLDISAENQ